MVLATTTEYFFTLLSKGCSCVVKMDAFRSLSSRRFYSSISLALCSVPASKIGYLQGKITNEFS